MNTALLERTPGCVAVVDDDPQILWALDAWLGLHGLRAQTYSCAESLLESVASFQSGAAPGNPAALPWAGAIFDLSLPGIHGIELARKMRRWSPRLPIVIVTALHNDALGPYGTLPLGVRCLQKPFDLDELEDALFPLMK